MGATSPRKPVSVHSMVGTSHPSCCLRGSRSANRRHSQCAHARLRQFRKVPVYLLPWRRPPKTSCTIHTNHSLFVLFLFLFLFFFLLFFSMDVHFDEEKKKKKRQKRVIIRVFVFSLQQTTFRAPFSKKRSRRHWVFSMVQNGMLWLEHTPATLLWDSSTKRLVGRWRLFHSVEFVFFHFLPFGRLCQSSRSRCASSCEEPDGRTWRNICGHEEHLVSQTCLGQAGFVVGDVILMLGKI